MLKNHAAYKSNNKLIIISNYYSLTYYEAMLSKGQFIFDLLPTQLACSNVSKHLPNDES